MNPLHQSNHTVHHELRQGPSAPRIAGSTTRVHAQMGQMDGGRPDHYLPRDALGECVLHQGSRSEAGYGIICKGRGCPTVMAHKGAWQKINGPVPEGYQLHHRCENRPCIRVDHLQLVTDYEHRLIHGMYTADDLIAAMWGFEAKYGRQPEASDWDATKARANGKPERAERYYRDGWPHVTTAIARFGSWSKALKAAGFEAQRGGKTTRHPAARRDAGGMT